MYERLEEKHKILQKENLKAAPDKTYLMLKKVKILGFIIGNKKNQTINITNRRISETGTK